MRVIETIEEMRRWRAGIAAGARVPFVPTMGALHEGHASLARQARAMAESESGSGAGQSGGRVIASIFVNPTQFGPSEDFARYPRTLEADLAMLEAAGCDWVFVPGAAEMYPGEKTQDRSQKTDGATVDAGLMGTVLEGAIRPGHFRGVCTVVAKLLNIVQPTHLLLGQKDYQQQAILRRMCADLNVPVEVVTCATIREPDGLAMSSRNRYLSAEERSRAAALFEALTWGKEAYERGERQAEVLEAGMRERIEARGLAVQYAVVADAETLGLYRQKQGSRVDGPAVLLVAAKLGATRLIDNMLL